MKAATPTDEDQLDRLYQWNSWAFLFVALALAFSALRMVASPDSLLIEWSGVARGIFLILTPVCLVLVLWKSVSFKRRGYAIWVREGFIFHLRTRAITASWLATLVALAFLPEVLESFDLAAKFYLRLISAIEFGTFGLTYLILSLANRDTEVMS